MAETRLAGPGRPRWRARLEEYREMSLGIACTLVGIAALLGASYLFVWAIVSVVH